ncbi:hypothetical protein [uncultured Duncaniella sp.]|uniref:hypothetical protein n=2 Tax=uncultured Duncaniella sp. TaxID=2768039 RepID=UPI002628DC7F|nr:hypothetical protein [uncultured Duncaniella sp.]
MPQIIETPLKNLIEPWENHRGRHIEEIIKRELLARATTYHFDPDNCRYLAFASPEARDTYLADPVSNPSLLLAIITIPLGHTASTAYPGHEGAQLRADLDTLSTASNSHAARITATETAIRTVEDSVGTILTSISSLDTSLTSLSASHSTLAHTVTSLTATVTSNTTLISELSGQIESLTTDTGTQIESLSSRIDKNTSDITAIDTRTTPILVPSEDELLRMIEAGECDSDRIYYTEETD